MSLPTELEQWTTEVSTHMPHLTQCQARVLAWYSYGMALTKHCGQTTVTTFLSLLLGLNFNTVRQRLREWTYEAQAKRGPQRQAIEVCDCFAPLLSWILHYWQGKQLVLAMDATYLGSRFMILAVSVVYQQCAIPVAWYILPGEAQREWHPLWTYLLNQIKDAIPEQMDVYVLTDRGLCSKRLFQILVQKGWHPIMRVRLQGKFKRPRAKLWRDLKEFQTQRGIGWCDQVWIFKGNPICCTLCVYDTAQHDEPLLIITDLPPAEVRAQLYALRFWIECGFKDQKRGGLRWEQTKMSDPRRVERLWIVMSVALIRYILAAEGAELAEWVTPCKIPDHKLSRVTFGQLVLLVAAIQDYTIPTGAFAAYDPALFARTYDTYP